MNTESKKEQKKNVATGISAAAGSAAGALAGAAFTTDDAVAYVVDPGEPVTGKPAAPKVEPAAKPTPQPASQPTGGGETPANGGTTDPAVVPVSNPTPQQEPEVRVVGYERMTNPDGSQMDVAVLNVEGREIGVVDVDLDGSADLVACDLNQNGQLDPGEVEIVPQPGMPMQPLQEAAGFNPLYAQNDMPDYVDDANVDTFSV